MRQRNLTPLFVIVSACLMAVVIPLWLADWNPISAAKFFGIGLIAIACVVSLSDLVATFFHYLFVRFLK